MRPNVGSASLADDRFKRGPLNLKQCNTMHFQTAMRGELG